jgi:hypothetical protein
VIGKVLGHYEILGKVGEGGMGEVHRARDPFDRRQVVLPLSGDRKPWPFARTQAWESGGRFSPDGKWVAYVSTETRRLEVYVRPFRGPGEATQISTQGGDAPVWRGDSREIFYVAPGNFLTAAQIKPDTTRLQVTGITRLFPIRPTRLGRFYDVSPDGQRFLVNALVETGEQPVTLVQNWLAGLKK